MRALPYLKRARARARGLALQLQRARSIKPLGLPPQAGPGPHKEKPAWLAASSSLESPTDSV